VPLVEVIARIDRGVSLPKGLRQPRLALEADPQRLLAEPREANIFPPTLKTDVSGLKGNVSSVPVNESR
jgi:hypothetical protein